MFFAEFSLSPAGLAMMSGSNINSNDINGVSFKIKTIDKPKVTLTTQELNQYNKKRLVYTKVEYSEATLRIFDTVDNSLLSLWVDYFTYFFGDSRQKQDGDYQQSPMQPIFSDGTGWGLRTLSNDTVFFQKITIYALYANTYTSFSYMNPKITSIDWQNKDYTSNEPEETAINIKYESIRYEKFGQPFLASDYLRFGWQPDDLIRADSRPGEEQPTALPLIFRNEPASLSQTNDRTLAGGTPASTTATGSPGQVAPAQSTSSAPGAQIPQAIANTGLALAGGLTFNFG